jgi:hypothetical protein
MATQRKFTLNSGKLPEGHVFKGQAKIIADQLSANPGQTTAEMAKAIGTFEGSRQTADRVIGFYMTTWKKKGWVKVEETEVPVDTAGKADEADSGEEDEDEEDDNEVNGGKPLDERLPEAERVQFHEELSASEPSPGGRFDGMKMSEAVKTVIQLGKAHTPENIASYLTENGYAAVKNQVWGALNNLVKQGAIAKSAEGTYDIRQK